MTPHQTGPDQTGPAIEFGKMYRDDITGWEGKATATRHHLGDLPDALLERLDPDGAPVERWFAVARLTAIDPPTESIPVGIRKGGA